MLDELRDMLVERLLAYEKKNKVLPQRMFVFRDGVSEVSITNMQIMFSTNVILTNAGSVRYSHP